ncbi:uncharacterized protein [Dermacentor albipictus]|uniref:uncharacterized protein isoform X5 n=1 Tax=Dermacentor albipictus TaxID=60249 RepID=UPI0038FC2985
MHWERRSRDGLQRGRGARGGREIQGVLGSPRVYCWKDARCGILFNSQACIQGRCDICLQNYLQGKVFDDLSSKVSASRAQNSRLDQAPAHYANLHHHRGANQSVHHHGDGLWWRSSGKDTESKTPGREDNPPVLHAARQCLGLLAQERRGSSRSEVRECSPHDSGRRQTHRLQLRPLLHWRGQKTEGAERDILRQRGVRSARDSAGNLLLAQASRRVVARRYPVRHGDWTAAVREQWPPAAGAPPDDPHGAASELGAEESYPWHAGACGGPARLNGTGHTPSLDQEIPKPVQRRRINRKVYAYEASQQRARLESLSTQSAPSAPKPGAGLATGEAGDEDADSQSSDTSSLRDPVRQEAKEDVSVKEDVDLPKVSLGRHRVTPDAVSAVLKSMCDSGQYHLTDNNCQEWVLELLHRLDIKIPEDSPPAARRVVREAAGPLALFGASLLSGALLLAGLLGSNGSRRRHAQLRLRRF